jgi:dTDP-4-dehydrorhamnose reductase
VKVLITGSNGQLGRALQASAPIDALITAVDLAELDISDGEATDAFLREAAPDLIINAAAYTAVDRAEQDVEAAFAANHLGPKNLARIAALTGTRLVHVSTDFVFDGQAATPYTPEHPFAPLGVYGQSKADGEVAVLSQMPTALIVRTAWVYAAQGNNFMRTMLRLMSERPEVRVVADQMGTPTHADSLARALWRLVEVGAQGVHHFTDAGTASWYDFAVAIQEEALEIGLLERPVPIIPIRTQDYPTPARRPAYGVLDKTATYSALGAPAAHWRAELRDALTQFGNLKHG